jgi:hypothetical protein
MPRLRLPRSPRSCPGCNIHRPLSAAPYPPPQPPMSHSVQGFPVSPRAHALLPFRYRSMVQGVCRPCLACRPLPESTPQLAGPPSLSRPLQGRQFRMWNGSVFHWRRLGVTIADRLNAAILRQSWQRGPYRPEAGRHRDPTISNLPDSMQMGFISTNVYIRVSTNQTFIEFSPYPQYALPGKTPIPGSAWNLKMSGAVGCARPFPHISYSLSCSKAGPFAPEVQESRIGRGFHFYWTVSPPLPRQPPSFDVPYPITHGRGSPPYRPRKANTTIQRNLPICHHVILQVVFAKPCGADRRLSVSNYNKKKLHASDPAPTHRCIPSSPLEYRAIVWRRATRRPSRPSVGSPGAMDSPCPDLPLTRRAAGEIDARRASVPLSDREADNAGFNPLITSWNRPPRDCLSLIDEADTQPKGDVSASLASPIAMCPRCPSSSPRLL